MTHVKGDVRRYAVFRSFINVEEQRLLVRESLQCHLKNSTDKLQKGDVDDGTVMSTDWNHMETSSTSQTFQLGVRCGADLTPVLPLAAAVAKRAFRQATLLQEPQLGDASSIPALETLSQPSVPLAGLALLYGLKASMPPHYDSPTQPGQREEWLIMMTMGRDVRFRCDDDIVQLQSGDVLVMDSMAVLHGVESIVDTNNGGCDEDDLGLPIASRLGILFWQGQSHVDKVDSASFSVVEGVGSLFPDSDDE